MQMFFKNRESARSVKSGKMLDNWQVPEHRKGVNNGKDSMKRWGRLVEAKPTAKETLSLISAKHPEKSVLILKVKKNKLSS